MSEANNLKATVYARLEAIAAAEKITRAELREMSRELLMYVPDTHDIDIVNRLVGVLTPVNRKVAILYFTHFLPWEVEKEADGETFVRFGKMLDKPKQVKRRLEAITDFLKDEANNIWTWAETNVETELKKKDFRGEIVKVIHKAMKGDKKSDTPALNHTEIMMAVLESGISIDDLMNAVQVQQQISDLMSGKTPEPEQAEPEQQDAA